MMNNGLKEIGGYIELDKSFGDEYHKEALALNSGRHCLEYLIRAKNITKVYLPKFLCSSVKNLCDKCNCTYEYYSINKKFEPIFDLKLRENEYLYIVNYYGQILNEKVAEYKNKYENIIFDNAQAFFQKNLYGVDTVYTCRKFFGVSDGGYLYTDAHLDEKIVRDESYERIHYVLGRFERGASEFYQESVNNNKFFGTETLKLMSKLTQNLLRNIDYEAVSHTRKENFMYLHNHLKKRNKFNLVVPEGAFMYPLYIENGAELKKTLISNKIFVPTLWGDVFEVAEKKSLEYEFANNIVPIPVDQRYDTDDMKYILEVIKNA